MEWLVSALSSSGLAGVTGLIGGAVSKIFEAKAKRLELEYQIELRKLDVEEALNERNHELKMADKQVERAQVEGEIEISAREMQAFTVSQREGNRVEGVLRFVRPLITAYVMIACTWLFVAVWEQVGGLNAFTADQLTDILVKMVESVLYLTVMCIGWWFGSRPGGLFKR